MLRNGAQFARSALRAKFQGSAKEFSNRTVHLAKNTSLQRQGKIMNKLFGKRLSGSKKRWYQEGDNSATSHNGAAQLTKASGGGRDGKNTTRRMIVLNKLFMKHISGLLATGEASEVVLGRGLQIQRVKISPDFTAINVYWLGNGKPDDDNKLELELHRCSGLLRHELSQLALMGEVPRIKFLRDKTLANLTEVNALLRNMSFSTTADENGEVESGNQSAPYHTALSMEKREFFGQPILEPEATTKQTLQTGEEAHLPEMRHDVLGLDHRAIMLKILTKMKKSKQAWDLHNQQQLSNLTTSTSSEAGIAMSSITDTELERARRKLAETSEAAAKFDKFLANRWERKNTPERKKYYRDDELLDLNETTEEIEADIGLSTQQRRLLYENDYMNEEHESKR